jgi:hypothetical protein
MNENNLQQARQAAANALLRPDYLHNVVGVGLGNKFTNGKDTGTLCVRVYVVSKFAKDSLVNSAVAPASFLEVPTDVIPVGRYGRPGRLENLPMDTSRIGPGSAIRVEANVPNVNSGSFGTLGAVVSDGSNNDYILSCNHVLSSNGRVFEGREILSNDTRIGKFEGNRFAVELNRDRTNFVDCALGRLTDKNVSYDIPEELDFLKNCKVSPAEPIPPVRGMKVAKAGAISGTTKGTIVDVDAEGFVDYSFGMFRFVNQIVIDSGDENYEFAVSGDSGSVVRDQETGAATAMIFAGAGRFALACPLPAVLKALQDVANIDRLTLRLGKYDASHSA